MAEHFVGTGLDTINLSSQDFSSEESLLSYEKLHHKQSNMDKLLTPDHWQAGSCLFSQVIKIHKEFMFMLYIHIYGVCVLLFASVFICLV